MSSILKALKKLEEEKARQEQGRVDIATDILRSSGRQQSRNWGLPVLVAGLLLAGVAVGVYFSRQALVLPEVATPVQQPTVQTPQVAVPTQGPAIEAVQVSEIPAAPVKPGPAPQEPPEVIQSPKPGQADTPAISKPESREDLATGSDPLQGVPKLVVSGIVYQDDPQNRMAVINDLPVMSGTTIEGVEIVEIQPDRVVFNFEGKQFSIVLEDQP